MKILYLSYHSSLEWDELTLLKELGHEIFSIGVYLNPQGDGIRPSILSLLNEKKKYQKAYNKMISKNKELKMFIKRIEEKTIIPYYINYFKDFMGKNLERNNKLRIRRDLARAQIKEFVDLFDAIIIMGQPHWFNLELSWDAIKHKRVIWRTIGQSGQGTEKRLKKYRKEGLQIIRYSPKERNIPLYLGEDGFIRFYKDKLEFNNWNGNDSGVIAISNGMKSRGKNCNFNVFNKATSNLNRRLFGLDNENIKNIPGGKLSYEQMKKELRNNRVFFYTGTHPASYTLTFIEAMMTGIPIVSIGPKLGNPRYNKNNKLFEVPNIIQNGINGYISDDPKKLRKYVKMLLGDKKLARTIGKKGRETAISLFGKEIIKKQWKEFLKD